MNDTSLERFKSFITNELAPWESAAVSNKMNLRAVRIKVARRSSELGFFQMTQPKSVGGNPASRSELVLLWETLASANLPIVEGYVFGPGAGVLRNATGLLRERYMEPVLRGELTGSFGFTEPPELQKRTTAIKSKDGSELIVEGVKSYVTGGDVADFVAVMCNLLESDGVTRAGTALVIVPTGERGVSIDRVFRTMDDNMPGHAYMRFSSVRVPSWSVVGKAGGRGGMDSALQQIGSVRLRMSAVAVGLASWALDYARKHLNQPHKRSGKKLAGKEGVQLRFAELYVDVLAARSMLYRTAHLLDLKDSTGSDALAATKVFTTEVAGRVVDGCVQLCGGMAIVIGNPLEAAYKRVRQWRFAEGASDLLRIKIAKGVLLREESRL